MLLEELDYVLTVGEQLESIVKSDVFHLHVHLLDVDELIIRVDNHSLSLNFHLLLELFGLSKECDEAIH